VKVRGAISLGAISLFSVLLFGCIDHPLAAQEMIYFEDFEEGAGPQWSASRTSVTPIGQRRYLGDFENTAATLTLNNLLPHSRVTISFDLFIIRSWDGNEEGDQGPDLWQLTAMGTDVLLRTTFDNHTITEYSDHRQSYPEPYRVEQAPKTGAVESNTLGYKWNFRGVGSLPADAVYHLDFSLEHSEESLTLEFAAEGLHERFRTNESWGIDNVRVELED
jgi:hypothetical protein